MRGRSSYLAETIGSRWRGHVAIGAVRFGMARALVSGRQAGRRKTPAVKMSRLKNSAEEIKIMSIEKKSLINNMTATKKALIATTPTVSSKPSVGLSKVSFSKKLSKVSFSKKFSKTLSKRFSKK